MELSPLSGKYDWQTNGRSEGPFEYHHMILTLICTVPINIYTLFSWVRQKGDTWLKCDDDEVSPVHEEDVMKLSGGGDWHTAYLLVYGPRYDN